MDEIIFVTLLIGFAGGFLFGWFLAWAVLKL